MSKSIPVALITDDNFVMQTCVTITSILENKNDDTNYSIYVVMAECSEESKSILERIPGIKLVEASLENYKDIRQLAHIPIACLLKFNICDLLKQHDKIIYLDGDTVVRGDLTELYHTDLGFHYAAAVYSRIDQDGKRLINAGVMVFNAKKMRDDGMKDKLIALRKSLGDRGSMDQQSFNILLGDKILPMSIKYNCMAASLYEIQVKKGFDYIRDFYGFHYHDLKEVIDDAVIIHYSTSLKPWKYSHTPLGDEWVYYYKRSIFKDYALMLQGKWVARRKRLSKIFQENGIGGVLSHLVNALKVRMGMDKTGDTWG